MRQASMLLALVAWFFRIFSKFYFEKISKNYFFSSPYNFRSKRTIRTFYCCWPTCYLIYAFSLFLLYLRVFGEFKVSLGEKKFKKVKNCRCRGRILFVWYYEGWIKQGILRFWGWIFVFRRFISAQNYNFYEKMITCM